LARRNDKRKDSANVRSALQLRQPGKDRGSWQLTKPAFKALRSIEARDSDENTSLQIMDFPMGTKNSVGQEMHFQDQTHLPRL